MVCENCEVYLSIQSLSLLFFLLCQEERELLFLIIIIIIIIKKKSTMQGQGESDWHPISPKTPVRDSLSVGFSTKSGRAAYSNKITLAMVLKPTSPTSSMSFDGLPRSFHRDTDRGIKVLLWASY